jgi:glycosyltransferase involved in cell wall biosynthesis
LITVARDPAPGVNLVGFLEAESGLGEIARKLGRGLDSADIPFAAIPYRRTASRQRHRVRYELSGHAPYDTNLICLNADELPAFARDVGQDFFVGRSSIGVWFWETNVFRAADRRASYFLDEVWALSAYVGDAVARVCDVPVRVAPIPVELPSEPAFSRADLGLPPGFLFLYLFDFVSAERKNPAAVVESFCRAFQPGAGPTLVLKSINGRDRKPRQLEELRSSAAARTDILLLDGYVSSAERDSFVAACDCFVSLHRSEGFGLTMAEAMAFGKPVIATGYSGNLEFMDEQTARLVPYDLVPVPEDWWAFSPGAVWAEPSIEDAAECMQEVFSSPERARMLGEHGRSEIIRRLSVERTVQFVSERFSALRERAAAGAVDLRSPVLRAALAQLSGDRDAAARVGWGPADLARRIVLRALWPYLEERRQFDDEVVAALARAGRAHGPSTVSGFPSSVGGDGDSSTAPGAGATRALRTARRR